MMRFKIGIDVGGTFTDLAVAGDNENVYITKTLSTPGNEAEGVMTGLAKLAEHYGMSVAGFLNATNIIVHGTTVATNIMLQYNGATTGLITTKGFRDEIEIRRGIKESMFNVKLEAPFPIVPRRRRLGVLERVDYKGDEMIPLDEAEAREAVRHLKDMNVESIAVCFLFSFLLPQHERRVREIILEEFPDAYVSLSSDVLPQVRDFERVSTTVVNAFVGPRLKSYLDNLRQRLREAGYGGDLFVMQSNGGIGTVDYSCEKSVYALFSGPAGGIAAATFLGGQLSYKDLITVDMGGTSYDVSLIKDCCPTMSTDSWVSRYRVAVPMIDIHSIGAGGGSIAWVDSGGALKVGPQSAGARPGPACYCQGGTLPTVTDADLVLGYLNASHFASREMKLDQGLAEGAIQQHVAQPLGMTVTDAAYAIFRIVNSNMANGIRVVSVQRGNDPRDFALMTFGGAGAVHAGVQARDLGIPTIIVPKTASVFCAFGDLIADIRITEVHSFIGELGKVDLNQMTALYNAMIERAEARLPRDAGLSAETERYADLRYFGEVHEVTVPIRGRTRRITEQNVRATIKDFHNLHEQLYAYRDPNCPVEVLNLRVDLVGQMWKPRLSDLAYAGEEASHAAKGTRPVFFGELGGFVDTVVYDGDRIKYGNVMNGPCIIEEAWTTIVVQPGQEAMLDKYLNYIIDVGE